MVLMLAQFLEFLVHRLFPDVSNDAPSCHRLPRCGDPATVAPAWCHTELRMPIVAIAITATLVMAAPQQTATGVIAGCISDINRPVPAAVRAKGADVKRTTRADASGCYDIRDLPVVAFSRSPQALNPSV